LQTGLQAVLDHGRDAAMVTLVDRPAAGDKTIRQLHRAFDSAAENIWAVVPEFSGKHGHPYVIGREMIEAFLRAPATSTAREIEHQHQSRIQYVTVDDPFVAANVNTPEEYARLASGECG
jgi:molybdenum cofactor cytidylyltransferase